MCIPFFYIILKCKIYLYIFKYILYFFKFFILKSYFFFQICPFPIFTRSGEVRVSLRLCSTDVILTERHVQTISAFLNFIFTSVLRLQKYLMSFDPEAEENSFFIVPTRKSNLFISIYSYISSTFNYLIIFGGEKGLVILPSMMPFH